MYRTLADSLLLFKSSYEKYKLMRKLFPFFAIASIMFACGDAGITFNLSTDFQTPPKEFNVPIPKTPEGLPDIAQLDADPPSETISYSLGSVDAFSGDLNQLGGVVINKISYEMTGIEAPEDDIDLDEFTIDMILGPNNFTLISIVGGKLSNVPKTEIVMTDQQKTDISNYLFGGGELGAEIVFDLAQVPDNLDNLNMNFIMYFDVTVKIDQSL